MALRLLFQRMTRTEMPRARTMKRARMLLKARGDLSDSGWPCFKACAGTVARPDTDATVPWRFNSRCPVSDWPASAGSVCLASRCHTQPLASVLAGVIPVVRLTLGEVLVADGIVIRHSGQVTLESVLDTGAQETRISIN